MKPQIIRGPLAALEARLAAEVQAFNASSPLAPLTILIGSTLLRPYLRRRLAEMHGGLLNLRLVTIHDLASSLSVAAVQASGATRLPGYGDRVIAEEVADQTDGYFARVAHSPGFAEALDRLFAELRQAGLDHESFDKAAGALSLELPQSAGKLKGLSDLYALAQERRAGFHGPDDLIRLADPARFSGSALFVYGLWGLTTLQKRMLERLMEQVTLTFFLPDAAGDASDAHAELRAWLTAKGAVEELIALEEPPTSTLARLQGQIFDRLQHESASPDGSVRLVSAPDTPREVREAARACLRWAREGIAFHEMAVAYRHTETYRGLIDETFAEAGIPTYLHDGRPIVDRPEGRGLAALIGLIDSRLTRAAVMEFLTETRLPPATLECYGGYEPAAWDEISRQAGIVEGRAQWFERLEGYAQSLRVYQREGEEPSERLVSLQDEIGRFSHFLGDFFDTLQGWPERDSWEGYRERLGALASDYIDGVAPILERLAALDRLAGVVNEVSFPRFTHAVLSALQHSDRDRLDDGASGAFGRRGVNVLDVNSLRHLRFQAVVVLGLTERAFPSPPRQDALLLDHERCVLSVLIPGELKPRARGVDPEPLQFALALAAARERLQLSFARGDAGGTRAHLPSYFFRAAAETLTGKPVTIAEIDSLSPEIFERVPANRVGAALCKEALSPSEYDRTLVGAEGELGTACLLHRSPFFARARQAWEARWKTPGLTAWDGVLDPGQTRPPALGQESISPTRLEIYATCPYRYFLQAVLRLEEVEEPETIERLSALDRGSLVHRILDRFLTRYSGELARGPGAAGELRPALRELAEEVCDEAARQGRGGYPLVWEFDRTAIFEDLDQWLTLELREQARSDLHPHAFEVRFGPAWFGQAQDGNGYSVDEPVSITFDGGTLEFHGRIDRIDWDDKRSAFRVIDYKTGRAGNKGREQFTHGTTLQLPIYLLAASHALRRHGMDVSWLGGLAEYSFATTRGGFKQLEFSGHTLQRRWDEFLQLLADLTGQIDRGDFHPEPEPEKCRFCLGRHVCDRQIQRIAAHKADAREARFLRIQDVD